MIKKVLFLGLIIILDFYCAETALAAKTMRCVCELSKGGKTTAFAFELGKEYENFVDTSNSNASVSLSNKVKANCNSCADGTFKTELENATSDYSLWKWKVNGDCKYKRCESSDVKSCDDVAGGCKDPVVFTVDFRKETKDNPYGITPLWTNNSPVMQRDVAIKENIPVFFSTKSAGVTISQDNPPSPTAKVEINPNQLKEFNKTVYAEIIATPEDTENYASTVAEIYFNVTYDCTRVLGAEDACDKPENVESCRQKCEKTTYCSLSSQVNGACVSKTALDASPVTTPEAPQVKYDNDYWKSQYKVPDGYKGALPDCAFSGTCRDTNDLVLLLIKFGEGMFAIIGSFAFVFFVYGGFTMILSFGNAEKVKKGQQILVAAVLGIVIAFTAYLSVQFLLDALNVGVSF